MGAEPAAKPTATSVAFTLISRSEVVTAPVARALPVSLCFRSRGALSHTLSGSGRASLALPTVPEAMGGRFGFSARNRLRPSDF